MEEIWKDVKGNENYEASNKGKVRNKSTKDVLKSWVINSGYEQVAINGKSTLVHRIIAETFHEKTEDKNIVNHIDNDRLNNESSNLEWVTYKENSAHASNQGRLDSETARKKLKEVSSKRVTQKDMEGNTVRVWDSPTQAQDESDKYFSSAKISAVANGHRKHHRNFIWEYENKEKNRSKTMTISMYDEDYNLLHENLSMNKIMNILGMNNHKTLRDKLRKIDDYVAYKGFKFKLK